MRHHQVLALAAVLCATPVVAQERPDIVVILTDDQEMTSMDVMPLTKAWLAASGFTFSNAHVASPLCCPSRATLLTGLYASQHGVVDNEYPEGGAGVFTDTNTPPLWLQAGG